MKPYYSANARLKSIVFKGEKCFGGKFSKERISLLLTANMSGTDKLTPMIIGKSKKPRCFINVKSLPVIYESSKKAWTTADIFSKWVL